MPGYPSLFFTHPFLGFDYGYIKIALRRYFFLQADEGIVGSSHKSVLQAGDQLRRNSSQQQTEQGDIFVGKASILVVEDDIDIQQLVSYNLIKSDFNVSCADSGEEGLQILQQENIDLIILDLMLPGKDGMEICSIIREKQDGDRLPIIMLTARSEEDDIITGFASGADDYVTKPFSPRILIARVQALLRRKQEKNMDAEQHSDETIAVHSMVIHRGRHEVLVEDRQIHLTTTEFTILEQLAGRPGWVFSRRQIIDRIRGYDYLITPRAVDVQIFGLRKKLGDAGAYIETVRGIGYRLKEEG